MSFFAEIRRRKVFQVAAVYAVVAWLLVQIVATVEEPLGLPGWFDTVVIVSLAVGFPIAVILAWAFDITPDGIKATGTLPQSTPQQQTGQRFSHISQGLVLFAVGFLVVDQYLLSPRTESTESTARGTTLDGRLESASLQRTYLDLGPTERLRSGLRSMFALSPDGTDFVYVTGGADRTILYRRRMSDLRSTVVTERGGIVNPIFSPSGDWIAFSSGRGYIEKIHIQGGDERALAESGPGWIISSSWGNDDRIYFTRLAAGTLGISRIAANGGEREDITTPAPGDQHLHPRVLPNGRALVFTIRRANQLAAQGSVALLDLETSETQTIAANAYNGQYVPSGHIVFMREEALWAVPFDLDRLVATGPESLVVSGVETDGSEGVAAYTVSDNGTLIYLPGGDTTGLVSWTPVWVRPNGAEEPVGIDAGFYSYPAISPDGSRLALQVTEAGNSDIVVYDLKTLRSNRLTFGPDDESYPLWTADGTRLIYWSDRDGGGLFMKSANGSGSEEQLTSSENRQFAEALTADGQLVFTEDKLGVESDLYLLNLSGDRSVTPLLANEWDEDFATISPDGSWLAYEGNDTGSNSQIFIRPFPEVASGSRWQISERNAAAPVWIGNNVYFLDMSTGQIMMAAIDTESGVPVRESLRSIVPGQYNRIKAAMDVAPDGERLLMLKNSSSAAETSSDQTLAVVVTNWFEELRGLAPPTQP